MVPQSKPHARGGIHRVDEDKLTGTIWDRASRMVMRYAAEGKNAEGERLLEYEKYKRFFTGFKRVKDLKKEVLLDTLGHAERVLEKEAKEQRLQDRKTRREAERQKQESESRKQQGERRRKAKKQQERNAGALVSDSEEEQSLSGQVEQKQVEKQPKKHPTSDSALSDSSNTTTTQSSSPHMLFLPKLHLFEWLHPDPPSRSHWSHNPEYHPKELAYVSLQVISAVKKEPLRLPGRQNKIVPESVPSLSTEAKDCARNGVLIHQLVGARIESGKDWAQRTIIQGWNGHMYFNLSDSPTETDEGDARELGSMYPDERDLVTIYKEWKQHRRLERKTYIGIHKSDPRLKKFRVDQQRQLVKNIYEFSRWHPEYVGFLPAYLGAPQEQPDDVPTSRRSLDALFYIILADEQVPSFWFWAEKEEWSNPTERNIAFEEYEGFHAHRRPDQLSPSRRNTKSRSNSQRRDSSLPSQQNFTRVRISPVPDKFRFSTKVPTTSGYRAAVWVIERDLFNHGYEATLRKYHTMWSADGKEREWAKLTSVLRLQLPPAGFPRHPPVTNLHDPSMISVAEKMARVHTPSASRRVLPIFINDDWTRNDDAYWTTHNSNTIRSPAQASDEKPISARSTQLSPQHLSRRISDVFAWVSRASSPTNMYYPETDTRPKTQRDTDLALRIMTEKWPTRISQHSLGRMMQERHHLQRQTPWICAICLEEISSLSLEDYEQHLLNHMMHIPRLCPFCGMAWDDLDGEGEGKANHVMLHRLTNDDDMPTKRRLIQTPIELQGWTAVPNRPNSHRHLPRHEEALNPKRMPELRTWPHSTRTAVASKKRGPRNLNRKS